MQTKLIKKQLGATLIEALVSILVMSLGLLGIAGIQLNAIAYQKSSWSTQRVAETVNDFAERIRSNPTGASNGNYLYNTANYAAVKAATFTSNDCRTSGGYCSTAQIAADDITELVTKAQAILPGGAAQVAGNSSAGFVVTVMFFDKDFVDSSTPPVLQSSATCSGTTTGVEWRNCCPTGAAAPAGVRCRRFTIIP
ncbi:MAG: type IV pilus modification protein PilV [Rhodoferax ferrireducens]|uniref:Type IV pilus modification protein PilV n=1 Tax=Rhodoferax ferrireducens TaxID=192843 RepID=A0A1W9KWS2_9BURK|nr:MAG: type IV pilus modification protein PilV [Rhodoferax ferrireducens]